MRLRLTFRKTEPMRYTGHLDLHRTIERTFRRAGLPLAYSQGYHPQPKINLAAALPLGFTSQCELADVWLEETFELEKIGSALAEAVPPGIEIVHIEPVDLRLPALQTQVRSAEYIATLLEANHALDKRLAELIAAESLPRERRGKPYDLRPLIEDLVRIEDDVQNRPQLKMILAAREGATGRPEEVLTALNIAPETARVQRTRLLFPDNLA